MNDARSKRAPDRIGPPLVVLAGLAGGAASRVPKRLAALGDLGPAKYISADFGLKPGTRIYRRESVGALLDAAAGYTLRLRQHNGEVAPSRFYLVYVQSPDEEDLLREFDFFALPVGVNVPEGDRCRDAILLRAVEQEVRNLLRGTGEPNDLWMEIRDKRNKTPLLLPPKNFLIRGRTVCHQENLYKLRKRETYWTALNMVPKPYTHSELPKVISRKQKKWLFSDSRDIVFPPSTEDHGPARELAPNASTEAIRARLNALYRFGIPIVDGFHYDVQRVGKRFDLERFTCIERGDMEVSGAYVNIYPNDRIREKK